jgi:GMP synthase (glutamine-hydrolysing)
LCSDAEAPLISDPDGWVIPVRSVGVQGDARSYRNVLALDAGPETSDLITTAPRLTNSRADINRVIALCGSKASIGALGVYGATVTKQRLDVLREADAIVRRFCHETGFEDRVWQFPVVLLPVGTADSPESIVLRPVYSVDGMTADVVLMDAADLRPLTAELLAIRSLAAVFYDLTNKPPGTIEWE